MDTRFTAVAERPWARGSTGPGMRRYTVPHTPGLDGVRGLAAAAVLAYHLELPWAGGGFLGVEVFFTLSGFLITQLVVAELRRNGSLDVAAFARARARRLLPALVVCVAGTLVAGRLLLPPDAPSLRADALASLAYLQNWQLALGGMPYSEAFARPSPLLHVWSLSIEGQLYLLWPLLYVGVLAVFSRWTAVVLTLVLAWLSALAMAGLYSPDDGGIAYFLTPARASGFLIGAALALAWRPEAWSRGLSRTASGLVDAAGLGALVVVVVAFSAASEFDAVLYSHGGFLRTGLATAVVIVAATRPGMTAAVLSTAPAVALGRRSYGLYLYHWPVFVLGRDLPGPGWWRDAVCLGLTVLITEVSYRWWETPIRRGRLRVALGSRRPAGPFTHVAVAGALALAVVVGTGPPHPAPEGTDVVAADVPVVEVAGAEPVAAPPEPAAAPVVPDAAEPASATAPTTVAAAPTTSVAPPEPDPPPRTVKIDLSGPALVVGDSIALGSAAALRAALGAGTNVDAKVGRQFSAAPRIVAGWARSHDGPVVMALGSNGTITPRDLDAVIAAAGHRRVVLLGVAVARRWCRGNNAVLRAAAASHGPQVVFVDWEAVVAANPGMLGPDGVHPGPKGRTLLASAVAAALRR